jgi:hypothetical protein
MTIHVLVIRRRPPRWLTVVGAVALTAGLLALVDFDAPAKPAVVARPAGPGSFDASPMTLYTPAHVIAPSNSNPDPAQPLPVTVTAARPPSSSNPTLPELPYRFLGRVTDAGVAAIVLHGRGRTVTVRGTGPLDDDYAVDAIEDGYLMVRHVPLGTSQMLELTARQRIEVSAGSPDDSPPD